MTVKDIYDIAMPAEKRKEERFNIFVSLIIRPISVLLTKIFINTKIKPVIITASSILCSLLGFFVLSFSQNPLAKVLGWFLFFVWAVLDGVDGNYARCTNQCSELGDLWDTTGGYAAMVLMYFSCGIVSFYDNSVIYIFEPHWYLIFGGATAIFSIFPRLVMHKKKNYGNRSAAVNALSDKKSFGLSQIVAMNIISPSGFIQVIILICILSHSMNLFVMAYFIINFEIMVISLYKLLKM